MNVLSLNVDEFVARLVHKVITCVSYEIPAVIELPCRPNQVVVDCSAQAFAQHVQFAAKFAVHNCSSLRWTAAAVEVVAAMNLAADAIAVDQV